MHDLCIIILRHTRNEYQNNMWETCYKQARKTYPDNPIIVIDDHSPVKINMDLLDHKTWKFDSLFHGRAEMLPYYYFYHQKYAQRALVIHDSVMLHKKLDTDVDTYRFLWHFEQHQYDFDPGVTKILYPLDREGLLDLYYRKIDWFGCFGSMMVINHDYLTEIMKKYDMFKVMIPLTTGRFERMHLERAFAVIMIHNDERHPSYFGDIHKWADNTKGEHSFGHINMDDYKELHNDDTVIFKIWVGR